MSFPSTVWLLCNENLHSFEISAAAIDFACPTCGCKFGRLNPNGGPETTVTVDVKEPYAVPGVDSWISHIPPKEIVNATTVEES